MGMKIRALSLMPAVISQMNARFVKTDYHGAIAEYTKSKNNSIDSKSLGELLMKVFTKLGDFHSIDVFIYETKEKGINLKIILSIVHSMIAAGKEIIIIE